MQVNSASSYTPQSNVSSPVDNKNQVAEQRDRFRVQPAQENTEQAQQSNSKSAQQLQDQNKQPAQVERFDVDERALALVEQTQLENKQTKTQQDLSQPSAQSASQVQNIQSVPTKVVNSEGGNSSPKASYDKPSQQNQTAIAAYSSVDNIAQRESIQQVFGVDLLA